MRFLVVDDHALIREAMRYVLDALRPDATVLEAGDAAQALAMLDARPDIDLVLLDRHLPDRDGLEVLEQIRREHPSTAVVMLSGEVDPDTIRQALRYGALGFIPKSESRDVVSSALALVLAGGVYIPTSALGAAAPARASPTSAVPGDAAGSTPREAGLTERQVEVLALLVAGRNNKTICRALGLAEPTVKNHVSAILRALGVSSRMEAVAAVSRKGWNLPAVG